MHLMITRARSCDAMFPVAAMHRSTRRDGMQLSRAARNITEQRTGFQHNTMKKASKIPDLLQMLSMKT
jgi:hypothetical protein